MTAPKSSPKAAKAAAAKAVKPPHRRTGRDGADSQAQKRLTSERISADLADFRKSGGHVEKLGVTRVLTRVDEPAAAPAAKAAK
jgi:hypothetical protein